MALPNTWRRTSIGSIGAGMAMLAFSAFAPTAGATDNPTPYDGNPSCSDLGFSVGLKIDAQPAAGTYAKGSARVDTEGTVRDDLEIEISGVVATSENVTFDWYASVDDGDDDGDERDDFFVDVVLVKEADGGLRWSFAQPGASAGTAWSNKDSISHVSFCFDADAGGGTDGTTDNGTTDNGTTTGGTDDGTTTGGTDNGTTTGGTDNGTTTGGTDNGTTTGGTATGGTDNGTTTGAAVLGNTLTRGANATPSSSSGVLSSSDTLPVTGNEDLSLAIGGAALIGLGAAGLVTSRRLRQPRGAHHA